MPTRLIREGILTSDKVASLSWEAEVFYRRLMSAVDDYGLYDARPAILRSALYPLQLDKMSECNIQRCLAACEAAGLVLLYSHAGKPFLMIRGFGQAFRSAPKCPLPDGFYVSSAGKGKYVLVAPDCLRSQGEAADGGSNQVIVSDNGCAQLFSYSDADAESCSDAKSCSNADAMSRSVSEAEATAVSVSEAEATAVSVSEATAGLVSSGGGLQGASVLSDVGAGRSACAVPALSGAEEEGGLGPASLQEVLDFALSLPPAGRPRSAFALERSCLAFADWVADPANCRKAAGWRRKLMSWLKQDALREAEREAHLSPLRRKKDDYRL